MSAFILHNRNPNTKRPSSIGFYAGFIRQFRRAALQSAVGGQAKSAAVLVGAPPAIGAFSDGSHPVPPSLPNERRMYHSSLHALGLIAPSGGRKSRKGDFGREERGVSDEIRLRPARKSQNGDFQREEIGVGDEIRPQSAFALVQDGIFANFSEGGEESRRLAPERAAVDSRFRGGAGKCGHESGAGRPHTSFRGGRGENGLRGHMSAPKSFRLRQPRWGVFVRIRIYWIIGFFRILQPRLFWTASAHPNSS